MIEVGQVLVSEELLREEFVCNLSKCKGACCVEGDAGAPLEQSELEVLEAIYPAVLPYMTHDGIVAKCAIEKAYEEGKVDWQKPISCHLYPIRITQYPGFDVLNYDRWHICHAACSYGKELKVPVYKFLKTPLIRKYGADWYEELEKIARDFNG